MLARDESPLKRTPLHALHVARGGKMVPFAGYEMPVQYATGVLTEHNWTRTNAGLFDVSHMGQATVSGLAFEENAAELEKLVTADVLGLARNTESSGFMTLIFAPVLSGKGF